MIEKVATKRLPLFGNPLVVVLRGSKNLGAAEPCLADALCGHLNGCRARTTIDAFGKLTVSISRARLNAPDGRNTASVNATLPKYPPQQQ